MRIIDETVLAAKRFIDGELARYETWEALGASDKNIISQYIEGEQAWHKLRATGAGRNIICAFLGHNFKPYMVQDAIRAGEILTQVKDRLEHGEFLPWIEQNCKFAERTARDYMRFYNYRDKTASLAVLQSARQVVAQIESREKQTEELADKIRRVRNLQDAYKEQAPRIRRRSSSEYSELAAMLRPV